MYDDFGTIVFDQLLLRSRRKCSPLVYVTQIERFPHKHRKGVPTNFIPFVFVVCVGSALLEGVGDWGGLEETFLHILPTSLPFPFLASLHGGSRP